MNSKKKIFIIGLILHIIFGPVLYENLGIFSGEVFFEFYTDLLEYGFEENEWFFWFMSLLFLLIWGFFIKD